MPAIAHAASSGTCGRSGYRRRASSPVWTITTMPSSTCNTRGHTSPTPNSSQPAWISHGTSGVLCEYGTPLNSGTSQLPRSHISHATASVRVEYKGIGSCRKIEISARAVQASSGARSSRRSWNRVIARRIRCACVPRMGH